ncbi:WD40-repeat-containing domain protein [Gaertneriomyces semiglobifer]|nr:WD40-repeat-containing domain protein [Gaertneriomyces semiglobifer]
MFAGKPLARHLAQKTGANVSQRQGGVGNLGIGSGFAQGGPTHETDVPVAKPSNEGLRAIDASLGGENVRIAGRAIVVTTLKRSLCLDVAITSFDVCSTANLMVTCMGKVVYLWTLDSLTLLHKFGRTSGSVHRENVRDCKLNLPGTLLATCGEDKRIVLWNTKNYRAEKVIEAHAGIIYQIEFSADGERLFSASDDGWVRIWDCKTGSGLGSIMRHPSAIRSFDFNYSHPNRIVCGRSDGHFTTWDLQETTVIDDVKPDPEWIQKGEERNLMGWANIDKNHTGSILCVRISPSNRLLASGATDNTCKLWSVTSYAKDFHSVQDELKNEAETVRLLEQKIRIDDESTDDQILSKNLTGFRMGEKFLTQGFHADLVYTLRHEGPVLSVRFNNSSSIVITGCMDSTCRLWSTRRGDLLFQINVPAPVTSIFVDESDDMYCVCQNRILFFGIKAHMKEEDLPEYWQRRSMSRKEGADVSAAQAQPTSEREKGASDVVAGLSESLEDGGPQKITVNELRTLISHGLIKTSVLDTLLNQYRGVDAEQLLENMKQNNTKPREILRLIVNSKFHPRDILTAMATKRDADALYNLIASGTPIATYMQNLGFRPIDEGSPEETKAVFLDSRDFLARRGMGRGPIIQQPRKKPDRRISRWDEDEDTDWDLDDDVFLSEEDLQADVVARGQPRGKILHFIPSEQIKILKDFHSNRDMKPIFLRDLVLDLHETYGYPNFNVEGEPRDTRPLIAQRAPRQQGVRFNEMTFNRIFRQRQPARRPHAGRGNVHARNLPLRLGPEYERVRASLASSQTVLQPSRYLRARGLNVGFSNRPGRRGSHVVGHVYAEPIIVRQSRNQV